MKKEYIVPFTRIIPLASNEDIVEESRNLHNTGGGTTEGGEGDDDPWDDWFDARQHNLWDDVWEPY